MISIDHTGFVTTAIRDLDTGDLYRVPGGYAQAVPPAEEGVDDPSR